MNLNNILDRISFSKMLATLLVLLLVVSVNSCTDSKKEQLEKLPGDQEIVETITSQLNNSDEVDASNIEVTSNKNVITLSGDTPNLLSRQKAEDIAATTYGVLSVVNRINVSADRPDSEIDSDLNEAFATNPVTENWDITTHVNNGLVTLEGRAESWQERKLMANIAKRVKGVKEIENNVLVAYNEDRSDEEIRAEVKKALKMDSRIAANLVEVNVEDGEVKLSGSVSSVADKNLARELSRVLGTTSVEADLLEVHPEFERKQFDDPNLAELTEQQKRDAIMRSLRYDPRVTADSIKVEVEGDLALLDGSVKNLISKRAAAENAQNTSGINRVENNITVERKVVVRPEVPTTDKAIKTRIKNGLVRDPYVSNQNIDITVDEGIVTITGTTDTGFKKSQVTEIASGIKGVIAVNNNLTVTDSRPAS